MASRLRARGAEVFTPTLTGCGERAHLLTAGTNLDTHVADVLGVLEAEQLDEVILVGQSYGGLVAALAADRAPHRLARLVFVDGLVPVDGRSILELVPGPGADMFRSLAEPESNLIRPPVEGAPAPGSYDARLTGHPWRTFSEPAGLGVAWREVPATYIRCVSDGPVSALLEPCAQLARELGLDYLELESPHDAQWHRPAQLAELLATVAGMPGR